MGPCETRTYSQMKGCSRIEPTYATVEEWRAQRFIPMRPEKAFLIGVLTGALSLWVWQSVWNASHGLQQLPEGKPAADACHCGCRAEAEPINPKSTR